MIEYMRWHEIVTDDRKEWEYDGDNLLPARSALELVRDTWTADETKLIAQADAYWQTHASEFNQFFRYEHARRNEADLTDLVTGGTAEITADHWWWYAIDEKRSVA